MAIAAYSVSIFVVLTLGVVNLVYAQDYCGQKEPDPEKLCLSIKLPWQISPLYFCTEKYNVQYRKRSKSSIHYCPQLPENSLQISTPWDQCPLISEPDPCSKAKCPPPPFNRTCTEYFTDNYWDCCPHYYCDEGDRETCHIRKLEPGCLGHTRDKINCTGFIDDMGCCNKYQCLKDEKPGLCPIGKQQIISTSVSVSNSLKLENNQSSSEGTLRKPGTVTVNMLPPAPAYSITSFGTLQQCVGDYTCPSRMKCCPSNYGGGGGSPSSFITRQFSGDKRFSGIGKVQQSENSNLRQKIVHGYCMEPILENTQ